MVKTYVSFVPHKNKFLAWIGDGRWVCSKHPKPFLIDSWGCSDCMWDQQKEDRRREREARIEEQVEAIRRASRSADEN